MNKRDTQIYDLIRASKHFVLEVKCLNKKFIVHPMEARHTKIGMACKDAIVVVVTMGCSIRVGKMTSNILFNRANKLLEIPSQTGEIHSGTITKEGKIFHALSSQIIAVLFELKNQNARLG